MLSNLFFLVPAGRAYLLGLYTETFVMFMITTVSFIYHACDKSDMLCPGASIHFWRPFDDFVALYVFVVIMVFMLALGRSQAKNVAYIVGGLIVYIARELSDDVHTIGAIGVAFVLALALRLIYDRHSYPYRELDLIDLTASGLVAAAGMTVYVFQERADTTEQMRFAHGWWHVLLSISVYFAFESLSHDRSLIFWNRALPKPVGMTTLGEVIRDMEC